MIGLRAGSLAKLWTVGAPLMFEISCHIEVNWPIQANAT